MSFIYRWYTVKYIILVYDNGTLDASLIHLISFSLKTEDLCFGYRHKMISFMMCHQCVCCCNMNNLCNTFISEETLSLSSLRSQDLDANLRNWTWILLSTWQRICLLTQLSELLAGRNTKDYMKCYLVWFSVFKS